MSGPQKTNLTTEDHKNREYEIAREKLRALRAQSPSKGETALKSQTPENTKRNEDLVPPKIYKGLGKLNLGPPERILSTKTGKNRLIEKNERPNRIQISLLKSPEIENKDATSTMVRLQPLPRGSGFPRVNLGPPERIPLPKSGIPSYTHKVSPTAKKTFVGGHKRMLSPGKGKARRRERKPFDMGPAMRAFHPGINKGRTAFVDNPKLIPDRPSLTIFIENELLYFLKRDNWYLPGDNETFNKNCIVSVEERIRTANQSSHLLNITKIWTIGRLEYLLLTRKDHKDREFLLQSRGVTKQSVDAYKNKYLGSSSPLASRDERNLILHQYSVRKKLSMMLSVTPSPYSSESDDDEWEDYKPPSQIQTKINDDIDVLHGDNDKHTNNNQKPYSKIVYPSFAKSKCIVFNDCYKFTMTFNDVDNKKDVKINDFALNMLCKNTTTGVDTWGIKIPKTAIEISLRDKETFEDINFIEMGKGVVIKGAVILTNEKKNSTSPNHLSPFSSSSSSRSSTTSFDLSNRTSHRRQTPNSGVFNMTDDMGTGTSRDEEEDEDVFRNDSRRFGTSGSKDNGGSLRRIAGGDVFVNRSDKIQILEPNWERHIDASESYENEVRYTEITKEKEMFVILGAEENDKWIVVKNNLSRSQTFQKERVMTPTDKKSFKKTSVPREEPLPLNLVLTFTIPYIPHKSLDSSDAFKNKAWYLHHQFVLGRKTLIEKVCFNQNAALCRKTMSLNYEHVLLKNDNGLPKTGTTILIPNGVSPGDEHGYQEDEASIKSFESTSSNTRPTFARRATLRSQGEPESASPPSSMTYNELSYSQPTMTPSYSIKTKKGDFVGKDVSSTYLSVSRDMLTANVHYIIFKQNHFANVTYSSSTFPVLSTLSLKTNGLSEDYKSLSGDASVLTLYTDDALPFKTISRVTLRDESPEFISINMNDNKITLKDFQKSVKTNTTLGTSINTIECKAVLRIIKDSCSLISLIFDMEADEFVSDLESPQNNKAAKMTLAAKKKGTTNTMQSDSLMSNNENDENNDGIDDFYKTKALKMNTLVERIYIDDLARTAFYNHLKESLTFGSAKIIELDVSKLQWKNGEETKSVSFDIKVVI